MRKLTIIFITTHADTLGNSNRLEMVNFISKYFETIIITNKVEFIKERCHGCRVIGYENKNNKSLPVISDYFEWKKLSRLVNSSKSDLCFMVDNTSPVANYVNVPVFQYMHQYGNRSSNKDSLIKSIFRFIISYINEKIYLAGLKKSKTVFVVSEPIINILNKKGIKNLVHTPHGINIEKYRNPLISNFHSVLKEKKNDGFFIVSYIGWVTENRGFQLMMDAIKEAVKQDERIILVIAGADENFTWRIAEFQKSNNLEKNIYNYGIIDSSLIPGILYYSDVCLSFLDDVPAYHISPPQKIIEYFAAGKPVICNKIEPHEWLVEDGKTGYILEKDPVEVSKAILKLKTDNVLHQTMCKNALYESQKYDINKVYSIMIEKMNETI